MIRCNQGIKKTFLVNALKNVKVQWELDKRDIFKLPFTDDRSLCDKQCPGSLYDSYQTL